MTKIEDEFQNLNEGLRGSAHQPGMFELVRQTNRAVQSMNNKLDSQSRTIDSLSGAKQRIAGIAIGAGAFGSILTWLANWFSTKH